MFVVETIARIRRAYFVQGKSIKAICRELRGSRKGGAPAPVPQPDAVRPGLPARAVEAACFEALRKGVHSADVVLDVLARQREPPPPLTSLTPDARRPAPDSCADGGLCPIRHLEENCVMESSEILTAMAELKLYWHESRLRRDYRHGVKRQHGRHASSATC